MKGLRVTGRKTNYFSPVKVLLQVIQKNGAALWFCTWHGIPIFRRQWGKSGHGQDPDLHKGPQQAPPRDEQNFKKEVQLFPQVRGSCLLTCRRGRIFTVGIFSWEKPQQGFSTARSHLDTFWGITMLRMTSRENDASHPTHVPVTFWKLNSM